MFPAPTLTLGREDTPAYLAMSLGREDTPAYLAMSLMRCNDYHKLYILRINYLYSCNNAQISLSHDVSPGDGKVNLPDFTMKKQHNGLCG